MNAKVMIAVPNMGSIHADLVQRLIRWHVVPTPGVESVALLAPRGIQPHDVARNWCVKKFLETDSTHLFFVDSDVIPPENALEELIAAHNPVISGAYPIKKLNSNTNQAETVYALFVKDEDNTLKPIKAGSGYAYVDRCGGGCLLIRRDVLEQMPKPHFKWVLNEEGIAEKGEDLYFCEQLEKMNVELVADLDVICQHSKEILL